MNTNIDAYNPATAVIPDRVPTFGATRLGYIPDTITLANDTEMANGCAGYTPPEEPLPVPTTWRDAATGANNLHVILCGLEAYGSAVAEGCDDLFEALADAPLGHDLGIRDEWTAAAEDFEALRGAIDAAQDAVARIAERGKTLAHNAEVDAFFGTEGYEGPLYPYPTVTVSPLDPFDYAALAQRAQHVVQQRMAQQPLGGLLGALLAQLAARGEGGVDPGAGDDGPGVFFASGGGPDPEGNEGPGAGDILRSLGIVPGDATDTPGEVIDDGPAQ